MHQHNHQPETEVMIEKGHPKKRYIFASDFDQTLSFNDSGYVLADLLGIPEAEFKRKATGMAKLNLVQQGGELAYLLLHDPEFRSKVRPKHLYEAGKRVRLKPNIDLLYRFLSEEAVEQVNVRFQADALACYIKVLRTDFRAELWIVQQQIGEFAALLDEVQFGHARGLALEFRLRNSQQVRENIAGVVEAQGLVEVACKYVSL